MTDLIQQIALLRAKYHRAAGFNLFSLLRSSSDEVKLHSRYLAFLLNPQGAHNAGHKPLQLLLEVLGIEGFDCSSATVRNEHKKIDILVRNRERQAVIIENKIYACDQDEQLTRYNSTILAEGYRAPHTVYLTLEGIDADKKSSGALNYKRASYRHDILTWLEKCLPLVVREAGVRESLLQYTDLIKQLTSNDQSETYMEKLTQELLKNDNLLLVKDIQKAYIQALITLQIDLWKKVADSAKHRYTDMPEPTVTATPEAVNHYYNGTRDNKYFGLYYNSASGGVYLELNHNLYCGYLGPDGKSGEVFKKLQKLSTVTPKNGIGDNGLLWRYTHIKLNLKDPGTEHLALLLSDASREQLANGIADDLYELWSKVREFI